MVKDLDLEECKVFLRNNYLGHLAYISGKNPFVTSITYYYNEAENSLLSYTANGHKIDAMRNNEQVSLQVENIKSIQEWNSVLVHGDFEEIEGSTAKKYLSKFSQGVQDTIECLAVEKPMFIGDFSSRLQERKMPIVFRINIKGITGRIRMHKTI